MFQVLKQSTAFTLAEILIVMGIIGVVATLTIPTVMNDIQDSQYRAAFKKEFSAISQAMSAMRADNGGSLMGIFTGGGTTPNNTDPVITKYFRVTSKDRTYNSTGNNIWHDPGQWSYLKGYPTKNPINSTCTDCGAYILDDGTAMVVNGVDNASCNSWGILNLCFTIDVDTNGKKPPNTLGKDIQEIFVYKDITTPAQEVDSSTNGYMTTYYTAAEMTGCDKNHWGYGCAADFLLH